MFATGALFVIGLLTASLLRTGGSLWAVSKWTAVGAPIVVAIAVCLLLPLGRAAASLGLADTGTAVRLRSTTLFWMLSAIGLPWIVAWLMADLVGGWFMSWWQQVDGSSSPGAYLGIVRLVAGVTTYSVASALGVLVTILFDRSLDAGQGEGS
jgi:hypothetical protein